MKKFFLVLVVVSLSWLISSCAETDIVAKYANTSFNDLINTSKNLSYYNTTENAWTLESQDGDLILFSTDFSRNNDTAGKIDMDRPDIEFNFDAKSFINAGLDISLLQSSDTLLYEIEDGKFMYHFELSADSFNANTKSSFMNLFSEILRTERDRISYHEALDHYGIKLLNGNMFEWAKDLAKNDKDIVFVLNPEPLIKAGLDPTKLDTWIFAKVEMKDEQGKIVLVDKLLKPFNLK